MLYIITTTGDNPRYFVYDDSTRKAGKHYCDTPVAAISNYFAGTVHKPYSVFPDWPKLRKHEIIYATSESDPELFL